MQDQFALLPQFPSSAAPVHVPGIHDAPTYRIPFEEFRKCVSSLVPAADIEDPYVPGDCSVGDNEFKFKVAALCVKLPRLADAEGIIVRSLVMVIAAGNDFVPPPESTRLLYVTLAIVCAPDPLKFTVPVPAEKVPAVFVTVPPIFRVLEPALSIPSVLIQAPEKVWVRALVPGLRFKVAPGAFSVKPAPPMFPVKVAVPPVLITETDPEVVICPIFCAAVPAMVTGELPALKFPVGALIKSP